MRYSPLGLVKKNTGLTNRNCRNQAGSGDGKSALHTDCVTGLGRIGARMIILADIDRLMGAAEIGILDSMPA